MSFKRFIHSDGEDRSHVIAGDPGTTICVIKGALAQRYGTGIGRDDLIDACACAVAARDSNARLGGDEVDSRGLRMDINY